MGLLMTLLLSAAPARGQADDLGIPAAAPWEAPPAGRRDAAKKAEPAGAALVPLERSLDKRLPGDLEDVLGWRRELLALLDYAGRRPQVFPPAPVERAELYDEYREEARAAWERGLDLFLALDAAAALYQDSPRLTKRAARGAAFAAAAASYGARARFARAWAAYAGRDKSLKDLFESPVPALGAGGGTLSALEARFGGEDGRSQAGLVRAAWAANGGARGAGPGGRAAAAAVEEDLKALGAAPPRRFTLEGAARAAGPLFEHRDAALAPDAVVEVPERPALTLLPAVPEGELTVSSRVAYAVGAVRRWFQLDASTAGVVPSRAELRVWAEGLRPGDVLLVRRPWGLGSVGQPGWWDGAGLYLGTDADRREAFGDDALSAELRALAPALAAVSTETAREDLPTVVAAGRGGVRVQSLARFAAAAAAAALRPRVPAAARSEALRRAARSVGLPYDRAQAPGGGAASEGELVALAYDGALPLPEEAAAGRRAASAAGLARRFDESFGSAAQAFDFAGGLAPGGEAQERRLTLEAFRLLSRRPKWEFEERAKEGTR